MDFSMRSNTLSWWRALFFMQAAPSIRKAQHRALEPEDMPELHPQGDPSRLEKRFDTLKFETGDGLLWGLVSILKVEISKAMILAFAYAFCVLSGPFLVFSLVEYVSQAGKGEIPFSQGLIAGLFLCFTSASTGLFQHHYFHHCLRIMQSVVSSLNMKIFRQGLRLTRKARMNRPTGDVVNLIGTDTDIVSFAIFEGIELIIRIFIVFCAGAMLIKLLGLAGLFGLLTLIIFMPIARKVARSYMVLDNKIMEHRDSRVSLMSQLLSGIRIVKYFAWEKDMQREVSEVRGLEISTRRKQFKNIGLGLIIYFVGSLVVGVVSFLSAIALGRELDAATLFSALAIFGLLDGSIGSISEIVSIMSSARVSAGRISSFLKEEILPASKAASSSSQGRFELQLENASFRYEDDEQVSLKNINLKIHSGESIAVVGSVGAGKSTLLLSLLEEIPQVEGSLSWLGLEPGKRPALALVPQEALIINGSLRENILLGSPERGEDEWTNIIWASALDKDLLALKGGLNAEIGEQGINLSGGQKQRLNLARAAMRNPDLLLLDDPLSAVDFHTEDQLMDRLLFGLWKNKTKIVVTHRLHHLERFDRVIYMRHGAIEAIGSFQELQDHNALFRSFLQRAEREAKVDDEAPAAKAKAEAVPSEVDSAGFRITDEEERSVGGVQFSVYKTYAKAWLGLNPGLAALQLALVSLLAVGLPVMQQSWLAFWSNHKGSPVLSLGAIELPSFFQQLDGAIILWGSLGFLAILAAAAHQRLWLQRAVGASARIHDRALQSLLLAPLNYFDRTPIGRILNRFSRDMDSVEREIAGNLERTIGPILHTLAAMLILIVNIPLLIFAIVPSLLGYYALQKRYRNASRDSQRLTSIARSPRFAFFKESLQAAPLLRAHEQEENFAKRYETMLGHYQRMFYASILFNRWFSSRIPMLGAIITFGLIAAILWLSQSSALAAGTAGLTLVYALRLCDHLNNAIRAFTVVESNLIAVERLDQLNGLDAEVEPNPQDMLAADAAWPTEGVIEFRDVSLRYAPQLPYVLKSLNLKIEAHKKLGVIGRTGAGKSTLFQSLYRFVLPNEGQILIDGIDTKRIPLDRLRRAIAIIPQDPILFKGSLRRNLDRFSQYSDEQIFTALRRSHIEEWVNSLAGVLSAEVKESGSNFSQGQRQQLCLARALLIDSPIIVLDEATASVDVATDALIQETIRIECRDKTVLIIAHRLETLGLCDAVVEMREGRAYSIR
jgi:ABC-type multidrug transport system fused ATPase/permease subunit